MTHYLPVDNMVALDDVPTGEHKSQGAPMPASKFKSALSDEQRAAWRTLYLALQPFRDLNPSMPLSYLTAMAHVAMDEGKGVAEYAAKIGISPTVMTRNLLDIGDRNRQREEGYGLITQERDLFDLRKHNAKVTPKGKAIAHHVVTSRKRED